MSHYKACKSCQQTLSLDSFYKHNAKTDQLRPNCKRCHNKSVDDYRKENKDARNEYLRNWQRRNPEKTKRYREDFARKNPDSLKASFRKYVQNNPEIIRNKSARRRALKKNNGAFLITKKEVQKLYRQPCFYCNAESSHLDHVIPISRGGVHSVGNIVPACSACNLSKSDRFVMEWRIEKQTMIQAKKGK
jgi:5-methylcytosine-specific restriction endonuclease McrA